VTHRIDAITTSLSDLLPYPPTMREVVPRIPGRAFFPGGRGLFNGVDQAVLPARPILLFGQDFDTFAGYEASCLAGHEGDSPTWRGVDELFRQYDIPPESAFFTNIIMGGRADSSTNSGPSPAFLDSAFIARCVDFALYQIRVMQPSVVVTLGVIPSLLLGSRILFGRAPAKPQHATWKDVDIAGFQAIENVCLPDIPSPPFLFASSVHRCLWRSNVRHRSGGDLKGRRAHDAIWERISLHNASLEASSAT